MSWWGSIGFEYSLVVEERGSGDELILVVYGRVHDLGHDVKLVEGPLVSLFPDTLLPILLNPLTLASLLFFFSTKVWLLTHVCYLFL